MPGPSSPPPQCRVVSPMRRARCGLKVPSARISRKRRWSRTVRLSTNSTAIRPNRPGRVGSSGSSVSVRPAHTLRESGSSRRSRWRERPATPAATAAAAPPDEPPADSVRSWGFRVMPVAIDSVVPCIGDGRAVTTRRRRPSRSWAGRAGPTPAVRRLPFLESAGFG